ncbi:MAG: peptide chain release factor 3 [Deltaproteobacteria bacterium]|nr:peptide chain release factor 3 [Deltaproteobacteria bacterium]
MEAPSAQLAQEIARRRTFAIISHPDAGKTTLTEKLLLYGGAIHLAGAVKARRAARHATSDWMELEKQRGISITTSVLQFEYQGFKVNILDTPGHQDFSEDTYRTLTAADSAVMLIDCAKGVEAQTKKLFKVCRMRGLPIFTFVNKLDREGRPPLELLTEIEEVLGIAACPVNWPLGMGKSFRGVYELGRKALHLFESGEHGQKKVASSVTGAEDPAIARLLGPDDLKNFRSEIELLEGAGETFDLDRVLAGELTPVFFGSAMTNFGVEPFLADFLEVAPGPAARASTTGRVDPSDERFTGFVFKIQANMNPQHRDRIAFLRICSGHFVKGMKARHSRTGREVSLALPLQFMAQERVLVDEAFPGDVVGIHDRGTFHVGDSLSEGEALEFQGIPRFSPEHFARVRVKNALKTKQLQKGLQQLGEEGAIQVFRQPLGDKDPIVGAVGQLQFEVLKFRLEFEYGVSVQLEKLPYEVARWVGSDGLDPRAIDRDPSTMWCEDREEKPVVLFKSEWALNWLAEKNPKVVLWETADG